MSRLSPVLSTADFPRPELDALRLDGEIYRVDDCVAPIDEVPTPRLRAAALALEVPSRLIVEQLTAAWVWGALLDPPRPHQLCADISARARPTLDRGFSVREVVVSSADVVQMAGIAITTPLRTATDLARFAHTWGSNGIEVVRSLMAIGGFDTSDCAKAVEERRNLPGKRRALERIALCRPSPDVQRRTSRLA